MAGMFSDDTIAAVSTSAGDGGIGIVRLSGALSVAIADRIFSPASGKSIAGAATHTVHYGKIIAPKGSGVIDEVLVTVMRAPKSYTREDVVEINCHGGLQSVKKVLELAVKCGARVAEPGEFTKRAFLNGRIDLTRAEAVLDVIRSKTDASLRVAIGQLDGDLFRNIDAIREEVLDITSELEASVDFTEEDLGEADKKTVARRIDKVIGDIRKLADTYSSGSILREGVLAVICGKPNAGKSSLMNLLLKRDRVIVSPIPGTTRDAVEEMINLKGIPIRLVDTAGIISTKDFLEKEGIARSKKYLAMADIVILVMDSSSDIERSDLDIIRICGGKKKVAVFNKSDLPQKMNMDKARKLLGRCKSVRVSVRKRINIESLETEIADTVSGGGISYGDSVLLSNARHKELLDKALANMLSVKKAVRADEPPEIAAIDLKEAAEMLGLIIGKSVSDDILDRIFSKFCIGK